MVLYLLLLGYDVMNYEPTRIVTLISSGLLFMLFASFVCKSIKDEKSVGKNNHEGQVLRLDFQILCYVISMNHTLRLHNDTHYGITP
jgi:hypothetical protein